MLIGLLGLANNTFAHHVHQLFFNAPGGREVVSEQSLWHDKFGRIRDVVEGPDGFLYFSTSNLHTTVTNHPDDDRIVRASMSTRSRKISPSLNVRQGSRVDSRA